MRLNERNIALANRLRQIIMQETEIISDGEGVGFLILWSFLVDHADCECLEVEQLSREQLDSFIKWARDHIVIRRPN